MDEQIEQIVKSYYDMGRNITNESEKFKKKLGYNGLDSSDLETLSEQIAIWAHTLGVMNDRLSDIMHSRNDSI